MRAACGVCPPSWLAGQRWRAVRVRAAPTARVTGFQRPAAGPAPAVAAPPVRPLWRVKPHRPSGRCGSAAVPTRQAALAVGPYRLAVAVSRRTGRRAAVTVTIGLRGDGNRLLAPSGGAHLAPAALLSLVPAPGHAASGSLSRARGTARWVAPPLDVAARSVLGPVRDPWVEPRPRDHAAGPAYSLIRSAPGPRCPCADRRTRWLPRPPAWVSVTQKAASHRIPSTAGDRAQPIASHVFLYSRCCGLTPRCREVKGI